MLAIIQARSNSKRFNKKILFSIKGRPIIDHVFLRVKKSKNISKIVVATSKNKSDDELVTHLKKNKINYFRGELDNVSKRLSDAAKKYKQNVFVRINGDSPLIDYKIIDKAVKIYQKNKKKFDIITNVFPRTFPKGQSVEIIKTHILSKNLHKMNKFQKEHVTIFFYKNAFQYNIKNFKSKKKLNIDLAVDEKRDIHKIIKLIN
ncbi:hypothetical protein OA668_02730 [Candidatus Pelagibacter sp.]|nr:hypothetical protein [Candidatus Pelagibacter sp.]